MSGGDAMIELLSLGAETMITALGDEGDVAVMERMEGLSIPFFAEVDKLFAGPDRVDVANWVLDTITHGDWQDEAKARGMVDEYDLDHFLADWENPAAIVDGFCAVALLVRNTNLPIKVIGKNGPHSAVEMRRLPEMILVTVFDPSLKAA